MAKGAVAEDPADGKDGRWVVGGPLCQMDEYFDYFDIIKIIPD